MSSVAKKRLNVDVSVKKEDILQAVIIADSFNTRFAPLTHTKPRVLLPLVNRVMIAYTLECLAINGIQEVFIFCCSHSQQIKQFISDSSFNNSMSVTVLSSETFQSMGDVLRELDTKALIKSDFILLFGDCVANLPLKQIRELHKKNKSTDKGCVMTTIFRKAKPKHRTRSIEDEFVAVLDSNTNKILHFERVYNNRKLQLPLKLFQDNSDVNIRYDLQDTYISICSINVPPLFSDNFDYETLDAFINGILVHEELLGHSIYAHIVESGYAARVINVAAYDNISRDILQRFTHPAVPDVSCKCTYQRHNIYKLTDVHLGVDTLLEQNVAICCGTTIGNNSYIVNSTIGSNCVIGDHVRIEDSYIWSNVVINDNCTLKKCIIADNVCIKPNVIVNAGSIISFGVVLGPNITLDERSYIHVDEDNKNIDTSLVGIEGKGVLYEESVASDDGDEDFVRDVWAESEDEDNDDKYTDSTVFTDNLSDEERDGSPPNDELKLFFDEVLDSLQRGIDENVKCENLILEVNSSKHAYNVPVKDLNMLVIKAILELPDNNNATNYFLQLQTCLMHLLPLIRNYIKSKESQIDCLSSLEEYCLLQSDKCSAAILAKIINFFYDKDILDEEIVLEWHTNGATKYPIAEIDFTQQESLRTQQPILYFIKWLQEAEEESSSDASD